MTPQMLLLYYYQKVSHGTRPVPNLPSECEFFPWKKHFLCLQHLHLLSHVSRIQLQMPQCQAEGWKLR